MDDITDYKQLVNSLTEFYVINARKKEKYGRVDDLKFELTKNGLCDLVNDYVSETNLEENLKTSDYEKVYFNFFNDLGNAMSDYTRNTVSFTFAVCAGSIGSMFIGPIGGSIIGGSIGLGYLAIKRPSQKKRINKVKSDYVQFFNGWENCKKE
jgi:hypothetical protein